MLLALTFPAQNVPIDAAPSPIVIGFAFGLSLVTGILFGIAPAWMAARTQPAEALRSNTRTTAQGASLLQRGLVVVQAALSLVLLVAAGLFAQSLSKVEGTDMKLDASEPIHHPHQPAGSGVSAFAGGPAVSHDRGSLSRAAGRGEGGTGDVYADGGQQLEHGREGAGRA